MSSYLILFWYLDSLCSPRPDWLKNSAFSVELFPDELSMVLIMDCFTKYPQSILEECEGGSIAILQWEAEAQPEQKRWDCQYLPLQSSWHFQHLKVPVCSGFSFESSGLETAVTFASWTHRNSGGKGNVKCLVSCFFWCCTEAMTELGSPKQQWALALQHYFVVPPHPHRIFCNNRSSHPVPSLAEHIHPRASKHCEGTIPPSSDFFLN